MSSNAAVAQLRAQFQSGHEWLAGTMQDMTDEQLHRVHEGRVASIAAEYAHTVMGEDFLVSAAFGGTPLLMSSYAGKTGASEPPPPGDWGAWGRSVRVDMDQMNAYAQAVYAATDAYLVGISDADLERELDLSSVGYGAMPMGGLLNLMSGHVMMHMGEISCLKGLMGLKGYPF